jgi:prevent-host-death family protein
MMAITAVEAKQNFGELIDKALQEPVSITKHGRPTVAVISDTCYREYLQLKYERLKGQIGIGIEQADRGQFANASIEEIITEAKAFGPIKPDVAAD